MLARVRYRGAKKSAQIGRYGGILGGMLYGAGGIGESSARAINRSIPIHGFREFTSMGTGFLKGIEIPSLTFLL